LYCENEADSNIPDSQATKFPFAGLVNGHYAPPILLPFTRVFIGYLSTTWFTGMTTTSLPFNDFNGIIAEDEVELFMERHGD